MRRSHRVVAPALAALALAACDVRTTTIGNVISTCRTGTSCTCGTGNCFYDCPGGDCDLVCTGASNCVFTCPAGGCTIDCANVGNCEATCTGGGCAMTCRGTGNGILSSCPSGCSAQRVAGTGNCIFTPN
jgi:hypothetical protein